MFDYGVFIFVGVDKVGVTLANLLHIFLESYSANIQNINATTLKVNVII